jgi:hypothetical protein
VENIESVPAFLLVYQVRVLLELIDVVHHSWGIASFKSERAYDDHWDVCFSESLAEWMGSFGKGFQSGSGVTKMEIVVR